MKIKTALKLIWGFDVILWGQKVCRGQRSIPGHVWPSEVTMNVHAVDGGVDVRGQDAIECHTCLGIDLCPQLSFLCCNTSWYLVFHSHKFIFVSPELSSVRDYVITHSVRSTSMCMYVCMCMYVIICKIDHCIHIHWCIVMGLGHNDPWVESHMWPQQTWGQRSCRGHWPLVQVFGKKDQCIHILWCIFKSNITMIAKVCDRESRRDSWFENRLV